MWVNLCFKFSVRKPFDTRIFFDSLVVPDKFEKCELIQASGLILPTHTQPLSPIPQNGNFESKNTALKILVPIVNAAAPVQISKPLTQLQSKLLFVNTL
jgi:hypothetical protein